MEEKKICNIKVRWIILRKTFTAKSRRLDVWRSAKNTVKSEPKCLGCFSQQLEFKRRERIWEGKKGVENWFEKKKL